MFRQRRLFVFLIIFIFQQLLMQQLEQQFLTLTILAANHQHPSSIRFALSCTTYSMTVYAVSKMVGKYLSGFCLQMMRMLMISDQKRSRC